MKLWSVRLFIGLVFFLAGSVLSAREFDQRESNGRYTFSQRQNGRKVSGNCEYQDIQNNFGRNAVDLDINGVQIRAGLEGSANSQQVWLSMSGNVAEDDVADLESVRDDLSATAARACHGRRVCGPRLALGMVELLLAHGPNRPLAQFNKTITPKRMGPGDVRTAPRQREERHHTRTDPYLNQLDQPNSNEPNRPYYTTAVEADDDITCICPYNSPRLLVAVYDDDVANRKLAWARHYGQVASRCSGRCGAGCNSADEEAYVDCFDHDACVSHLPGGPLDTDRCGNELLHADDDYLYSFGWFCC